MNMVIFFLRPLVKNYSTKIIVVYLETQKYLFTPWSRIKFDMCDLDGNLSTFVNIFDSFLHTEKYGCISFIF